NQQDTKLIVNRNSNYNGVNKKVLDVGCGLGGTAEYVKNHTSYDVYGIDIDESSIDHAKLHHPNINFFRCDVLDVNHFFNKEKFDIIYMFNVFYTLSNQKESLRQLAKIAKPEATLVIFDYTRPKKNNINLKDLNEKSINPIYLNDLL